MLDDLDPPSADEIAFAERSKGFETLEFELEKVWSEIYTHLRLEV